MQIPDILTSIPLESHSVMLCFITGLVLLTASVTMHDVTPMMMIDQRTTWKSELLLGKEGQQLCQDWVLLGDGVCRSRHPQGPKTLAILTTGLWLRPSSELKDIQENCGWDTPVDLRGTDISKASVKSPLRIYHIHHSLSLWACPLYWLTGSTESVRILWRDSLVQSLEDSLSERHLTREFPRVLTVRLDMSTE
jgi:hypothetical protein